MAGQESGWVRLTQVVTNAIKVAGLVLAVKDAFGVHHDPVVLATAAFMMAGAQFGEGTIMALVDRFLGHTQELPPTRSPTSRRRKR